MSRMGRKLQSNGDPGSIKAAQQIKQSWQTEPLPSSLDGSPGSCGTPPLCTIVWVEYHSRQLCAWEMGPSQQGKSVPTARPTQLHRVDLGGGAFGAHKAHSRSLARAQLLQQALMGPQRYARTALFFS